MPNKNLSSEIAITFEEAKTRTIQASPSAVAGFVGVCQSGPIDDARLTTSFEEWEELWGGAITDGTLHTAAFLFYLNGGQQLWTVRVTGHHGVTGAALAAKSSGSISTEATLDSAAEITGTEVAPFSLANGDELEIDVDGGGAASCSFDGAAASVESGNGEGTVELSAGQTLTVKIDDGEEQTITFADDGSFSDISSPTAVEIAAVVNAQLVGASCSVTSGTKVTIKSDVAGSSSSVEVTGGTSNGAVTGFDFSTSAVEGTGNVADLANISAAEVKSVVEDAVDGIAGVTVTVLDTGAVKITSDTTGASSSLLVTDNDAATEFGLSTTLAEGSDTGTSTTITTEAKWAGAYGDDVKFGIEDASSGVAEEFDLVVYFKGVSKERFPNLTMDSSATRYVETIANHSTAGSKYAVFTDADAVGSTLERRPANTSGTSYNSMTSGDDGLADGSYPLDDNDFIGSQADETGLYAFDRISDISVVYVPEMATAAIADATITYVDVTREQLAFTVLDPPSGYTASQIVTYVETTAALLERTESATILWPRGRTLNRWKGVYGSSDTIEAPFGAGFCGLLASNDAEPGGIYQAPAGIEYGMLHGYLDFEGDVDVVHEVNDKAKRDLVFPKRINPVRKHTSGFYVDGARTLKSTGQFPYTNHIRGAQHIARTLRSNLQWVRHRNNTPELRMRVERSIVAYLLQEMNKGAFASKVPRYAFFVDVSDALNPPSVQRTGNLIIRIGLAFGTPAEFVWIKITENTLALEEELGA